MTQTILITLVVVEGLLVILLAWHNNYVSNNLLLCLKVMEEREREVYKERV